MHLSEDKCPKCGWKAPAGLLKCPFCKIYIRKPGSSSTELKVPDAADLARWSASGGAADEGSEGAERSAPKPPTSSGP